MDNPYLAERPGLVFAGLILVGCLLPFISLGFIAPNLLDMVGLMTIALGFGAIPAGLTLSLALYYLLYAVPIMAGWLIFQEARGQASAGLRARVGVIALAGPFAIVMLSSLLMGAAVGEAGYSSGFDRGLGQGGDFGLRLISSISFGWMLIIAAGAGLVATGMGWSPFGGRRGD